MTRPKSDLLQGTLDLLILKTLELEAMHGWGIAQRIQQVSEDVLQVNQGSLYPALYRLEEQGWIRSSWGLSENNRQAKYYEITKLGRKQLERRQKTGSASPPRSAGSLGQRRGCDDSQGNRRHTIPV